MKVRGAAAYLLPGLGDILWIAVFAAAVGMGPRMMNVDGDLGRHLTIGRYILDHFSIPTRDLFSHTLLGQPLTPHEWLAQVAFAAMDRLMGLDGVVLLVSLLIAFTFWQVFRRSLARSRHALFSVGFTVLAMAASSLHWLTRPHVFTFLLLALWIDALDRLRCGRLREWWRLPVMMLLWVNLHGAFIAGFVTWLIYGLGLFWDAYWKRSLAGMAGGYIKYYLLGGLTSLLVTLLNPVGIGLWATSVGYIGNRYLVSHTAEYLPPDFHSPSTWPFLMMLILLMAGLGLSARKVSAEKLFLSIAWAGMALYSVRNVPLFAILTAPILAEIWSEWLEEQDQAFVLVFRWDALEQRLYNIETSLKGMLWPGLMTVCAGAVMLGGAKAGIIPSQNVFDPQVFPVSAVDCFQLHPPAGNGFNYFPWGGYLLYRLWPVEKVFIDGQTDFYGENLTRQYEQVITLSDGWEDVLRQYDIRWVMMPPEEPLSRQLMTMPDWQVVYRDSEAVILVLSGPSSSGTLE